MNLQLSFTEEEKINFLIKLEYKIINVNTFEEDDEFITQIAVKKESDSINFYNKGKANVQSAVGIDTVFYKEFKNKLLN